MPNKKGTGKKLRDVDTSQERKENDARTSTADISPISPTKKSSTSILSPTVVFTPTTISGSNRDNQDTRKRKRCGMHQDSDGNAGSKDIPAKTNKVQKVACVSDLSVSNDGCRSVIDKFGKNEHVYALVTDQRSEKSRAIIITDNPGVSKWTRAKARALNHTPAITFPSMTEKSQPEIAALIEEELHSDEEDEEYTFKEDDFISDDDPSMTSSDLDSNPRTPQTPLAHHEGEEASPAKFTADGCFKIPLEKQSVEDMRIATRTRSKLCLEQTTIEAIQSEFIPPDVETQPSETTHLDDVWMQFLNDFSKPLSSSLIADDDDPINDPEYVAADKVPVDAEELRDVNISKKELADLVAELFEGLIKEGVSLESVELDLPWEEDKDKTQHEPQLQSEPEPQGDITSIQEISAQTTPYAVTTQTDNRQESITVSTISSSTHTQPEYSFCPAIVSTPTTATKSISYTNPILPQYDEQTRVVNNISLLPDRTCTVDTSRINTDTITISKNSNSLQTSTPGNPNTARILTQRDNFSMRKYINEKHMERFEALRNLRPPNVTTTGPPDTPTGFTILQHEILQQQLRIHIQFLTQIYIQLYCHPDFWRLAPKALAMLLELQQYSVHDASFRAFNLTNAIAVCNKWEKDLTDNTTKNKDMMDCIHKELHRVTLRKAPRFAPGVIECMLNSPALLYSEYLPHYPFGPAIVNYEIFAPSEAQLLVMGIEKNLIKSQKENKMRSVRKACELTASDTISGKKPCQLWRHFQHLLTVDYYNPVKYFKDHNCAPPVEHILIDIGNIQRPLPPRCKVAYLPSTWKKYLETKVKRLRGRKTAAEQHNQTDNNTRYSEDARFEENPYLQLLVDNGVLPSNVQRVVEVDNTLKSKVRKICPLPPGCSISKRRTKIGIYPTKVTINVNYLFGGTTFPTTNDTVRSCCSDLIQSNTPLTRNNSTISESSIEEITETTNPLVTTRTDIATAVEPIAFNFDCTTQALVPILSNTGTEVSTTPEKLHNTTAHNTSVGKLDTVISVEEVSSICSTKLPPRKPLSCYAGRRKLHRNSRSKKVNILRRTRSTTFRKKPNLKKKCYNLVIAYQQFLESHRTKYPSSSLIQRFYIRFKALELYTNLLGELAMSCKIATTATTPKSSGTASTNDDSIGGCQKRQRDSDDTAAAARHKKANRQEENLRQMMQPDSAENANRKDAIFAFNFYEKVEEVLKSDDCRKFNNILKTFDPRHEKASDLYRKMENLFLPDHPELAEVFLTFLLPSEAAEIGKFFEHFMVVNASTFINKLNVYFNKQPAQIRKIYNCLNELAEDSAGVTVKQVETKIAPLLKSNQFLLEWFMQQFPSERVPERLLPAPEVLNNLKEVMNNTTGNFVESLTAEMQQDSPTQDQQQQGCQLRYINGRIFYGSKITLPAKLSFMAAHSQDTTTNMTDQTIPISSCIHGIREHGEQRLAAAALQQIPMGTETISYSSLVGGGGGGMDGENDRSEDDDCSVKSGLVIDTGADDDSSLAPENCDEVTLRSHALRLNPVYYSTSCFNVTNAGGATGTGAQSGTSSRKASAGGEEGKISPRKQTVLSLGTTSGGISGNSSIAAGTIGQTREKRNKSPTKKNRSPLGGGSVRTARASAGSNSQPMVVIHAQQSAAIACAKKLKSYIEEADNNVIVSKTKEVPPESAGLKDNCGIIVAKPKQKSKAIVDNADHAGEMEATIFPPLNLKQEEQSDDQLESQPTTPVRTRFTRSSGLIAESEKLRKNQQTISVSTHIDSDEDCKLDIVTSLLTNVSEETTSTKTTTTTSTTATITEPTSSANERQYSSSAVWCRDEDKTILIEMKLDSLDRDELYRRIHSKLPARSIGEIRGRFYFLMDFLAKLTGK